MAVFGDVVQPATPVIQMVLMKKTSDIVKEYDIKSPIFKGTSGDGAPTHKSSYDIPVDENGYTKSSLKLGRDVHKEYKVNAVDNVSKFKEYTLPSGKRVDYIDFENKIIYELKPNNPNQIKNGHNLLQGYLKEIESIYGDGWSTVLDTY